MAVYPARTIQHQFDVAAIAVFSPEAEGPAALAQLIGCRYQVMSPPERWLCRPRTRDCQQTQQSLQHLLSIGAAAAWGWGRENSSGRPSHSKGITLIRAAAEAQPAQSKCPRGPRSTQMLWASTSGCTEQQQRRLLERRGRNTHRVVPRLWPRHPTTRPPD